jgi:23S rRNA pseudouridine1911/1915/1917 synthase
MNGERDPAEPELRVLAEREGVILAAKPARYASEPTPHGTPCVVQELSRRYGGRPLHAASRLDVGVSGVVLCTLGHQAAQRVAALRAAGRLRHSYVGIAEGELTGAGSWTWALGRGRDLAGRPVARSGGGATRAAVTHYAVVAKAAEGMLACFRLVTGRMHQIRAHAARAGVPLLGDRRYGGSTSLSDAAGRVHAIERVALHCARVELEGLLVAEAPVPEELRRLWRLLGGGDEAWERAAQLGRATKLVP